jgi:hypothetical protein
VYHAWDGSTFDASAILLVGPIAGKLFAAEEIHDATLPEVSA